jgi:LPS-assembly protein
MTLRIRLIITALLVCHPLLASPLVTSQLQPPKNTAKPSHAAGRINMQTGEEVIVKADQQEMVGDVFRLNGNVEITFREFVLKADQITYDRSTGEITATGNLEFSGGPHDEHLTATHGTYNLNTDSGRFYDVVGTTGARFKGRNVVLTSSEPFAFSGRIVDKVGRNKLIIHYGSATTCRLPHPKWTFNAQRLTVVPGQDAKIYHSTFRLFGIPVFYFPYASHPVERLGRKTGFLIPSIGRSSVKGTIVGESIYWAIDRSMDATLGTEYFSKRGWAQHVDYRAKPSDDSFITARYFGVVDRGVLVSDTTPGIVVPANQSPRIPPGFVLQNQGGSDLQLTAEGRFHGLRTVADVDYLSNFLFRLVFSETFAQAINSEVKSTAFVSDNFNGFSIGTAVNRYQNFQSSQRGDVITILHAPGFESSSVDRQIANSPVYWSYDAAGDGLSRSEPGFATAPLVGRLDVAPRLTAPLHWKGWSLRPEVGLRDTVYSDRLVPTTGVGQPESAAINRHALETEVELRPPSLARIFRRPWLNHNFKHVFEPRITYRNVRGVDNFNELLLFDARDVLSDTNEIEYDFVNRLYAKRIPPGSGNCAVPEQLEAKRNNNDEQAEKGGGSQDGKQNTLSSRTEAKSGCAASPSREIVTWELGQKYFLDPNFGGALIAGQRNVFTTSVEFTGIAFLTAPRRFSPIISRLRARSSGNTDIEWQLDYDPPTGQITDSMAFVNYRFLSDFTLGGGHAFLRTPGEVITSNGIVTQQEFNQYRLTFQYGKPNKTGLNTAATVGYDVNLNFLQYSAVQATYNWECCGLSVEYRRFALGNVRNENQFRFALTLANVGTFGTLRKQERLF